MEKNSSRRHICEIVNDSGSVVYENVDISEGHDICEIEKSDPVASKAI
jgi:hypothetical protein